MSKEQYQEGCKGCEPVMVNLETGEKLPPEHPAMRAIMRVWNAMTKAEKEAWHEFTCQNSREPQIMATMARLNTRCQEELSKQ